MASIRDILAYTQQNTRNRIVFCKDDIDGIQFVNVGRELSALVKEDTSVENGVESKYKQVLSQIRVHPTIGKYIAIENVGILFEPELKIDVYAILDSYSKGLCLFVRSDAMVQDDKLYFLSSTDNIAVNLKGLSYKYI
ncbi:MAG: hypothetical protein E7069_03755 [Bacteroidales bacterium]|jgi:phage pi2 protein 07|nr:hypothetical protein [Bacteroidales bacterium]